MDINDIIASGRIMDLRNKCDQYKAELSEATDLLEALVLSGGYLGSKPMQRADEFVRRMKKQEIGGGV